MTVEPPMPPKAPVPALADTWRMRAAQITGMVDFPTILEACAKELDTALEEQYRVEHGE